MGNSGAELENKSSGPEHYTTACSFPVAFRTCFVAYLLLEFLSYMLQLVFYFFNYFCHIDMNNLKCI